MKRRSFGAAALATLAACTDMAPPLMDAPPAVPAPLPGGAAASGDVPPPAPREFRAAWVATVANIDWPSKPGLSAELQRAEALALLERARTLGLNAIILQVRPAGDAIYPSALEPWTEFLGGAQGRPPWRAGEPAWDPLAFWVQEAHRRGLELHAWFNPYRARHSLARTPLVAPHIGVRHPEVVKTYGDQLWMDPAEPAAVAQTLAVVADVLRRYDVDGAHIDDYFYPYPVNLPAPDGPELPFPDDAAWARYRAGGGLLGRADWRRAQVDALVQALHRLVREARPAVRLGISPFGLPRPERRPPGITGFSQYDKLYADAERWLENGWLDYWAPQLYWPIHSDGQAFAALLDYWVGANPLQRHLWPGLFTSQVGGAARWPAREVLEQVALVRSRQGRRNPGAARAAAGPGAGTEVGATGHIHFSLIALQQDREGLATQLQQGPYAQAALVPATPWLSAPAVGEPGLYRQGGRLRIAPAVAAAAPVRWAVWRRHGGAAGAWRFSALPGDARELDPAGADLVWVQGVNRVGQLGARALIHLA